MLLVTCLSIDIIEVSRQAVKVKMSGFPLGRDEETKGDFVDMPTFLSHPVDIGRPRLDIGRPRLDIGRPRLDISRQKSANGDISRH